MRHLTMLLSSTALLAVACTMVSYQSDAGLVPGRAGRFPHDIHLGADVEFECLDCHETAEDEARAGMPSFDVCTLCHFGALEGEEGAEDLPLVDPDDPDSEPLDPILAKFVMDGVEPEWTSVTGLSVACNFSHATHFEAGVDCASCHPGLDQSSAVDRGLHVDMAACIDCHEQRGIQEGGCIGCHAEVDQNWKPPSHDGSWELIHGQVFSAMHGVTPATDCGLCHSDGDPAQSCNECHQAVAPRDHTAFFKNSGHGKLALFDRARCMACHKEDTCLECHLEQKPRTHTPGFGAPRNQHCLGCHFETQQMNACNVCHLEGAPAHALASTPPASVPAHATATACLTCHATVNRPKHPYTGDGAYCRRCHQ